ncbi:XdhC family protein [Phaeodactylibacter luteus]|uniref:XdhC family protein n=1 Tax=Phaeodactylibacter luteus TaxID=1564516 RepID=A0A5C6RV93_9BACT|nr:XdhC family protein [Phaeodactylibacter luteus]TXB66271.1 XdhC family protein [Phaeodactylibacter luteus]
MKEIRSILKAYKDLPEGRRVALATVVRVEGSSYRRTGARMLIMDDGNWIGGISGGCLEGDALRKAQLAILREQPSLVTYDTTDDDAQQIGVGLGCNGIIDVLIAPLEQDSPLNPLHILEGCLGERQPSILLTISHYEGAGPLYPGQMIKYENGGLAGKLPEGFPIKQLLADIEQVQARQKSSSNTYPWKREEVGVFIEFLPPELRLLLFGGNYDVFPMAQLARAIGHEVTVYANPHKLSRAIFKEAHVVKEKEAEVEVDDYTACILMAHDYKTDLANLQRLLPTDVPYIGLLGPRKRTDKMLDELAAAGFALNGESQARLHSPVGLDIGALSPEEIALSVLAEIRAFFSQRSGGFLKHRRGTIHERA